MSVMFLPPRIAKELDQILQRKLTIIEAGAGYGKSTLLVRWIEKRQLPCLWYALDEIHHDNPNFKECLLKDISEHLPEPLLLVFDNWQTAASTGKIAPIVHHLLRSTPSYIHFILCTRSTPFPPSLHRLPVEEDLTRPNASIRLNDVLKPHAVLELHEVFEPNEVLILDENTLALKPEEISSLIARTFGIILSLEQIEWLQGETEGWLQAVTWAGKAIADDAGPWNPDSIAGKLREQLFPYFETEIFGNLPSARQRFLLALALPDKISPQILGPLLAPEDYRENLEWATHNHIFLFKTLTSPPEPKPRAVWTNTWRFHPLFKKFLRSKLVQYHALHQSLTSKLGRLYLEQGQPQTAIPYLIQAGLHAEAAALLEELLPTFVDNNRLETCASLLALFPPETEQHLPNPFLALAEELVQAGRNTDALSWLRRAALGFGQLGDDWGITRALCAMGTAYTALGLTEEAEAVYRQAQDEAATDTAKRAVVLSYLARCPQAAGVPDTAAGIPRLRLQCLGPFEVWRGEQQLNTNKWRRRKALSVLKYLALQPGYKAAKEQLLDLLWPSESPEKASNSYYVAIHSLRRGLTSGLSTEVDYLEVERGWVALVPDLMTGVDVDEFLFKYQEGMRLWPSTPVQAAVHFQAAINLYRGDLLPDDLYEEWLLPLREHLKTKHLESLSYLARHAAAVNEPERALGLWHELLRHDPTNEPAVREAITLMCRLGKKTQALQSYRSFCRRLKDELETDPEPETQRLYTTLFHAKRQQITR
ncbi:hypothetical protein JCM15765_26120 [Paradesulfitobacterium aromaticivorans]